MSCIFAQAVKGSCKRKLTCISKYGTDSINKVTAIIHSYSHLIVS